MSLVLDGSATLAWIYASETTPAIELVFDRLIRDGALVPYLWHFEIANSLTMAFRKGRISAQDRRESLTDLEALPITADDQAAAPVWGRTLELADRHALTVYDATYLELALRKKVALATLDTDLRRAVTAEAVRLLGL